MKTHHTAPSRVGRLRLTGLYLLGLAAGLMITPEAWAQPQSKPRSDFWFPSGGVYSILITNDTVYFGGDFKYVGPQTGRAALFDVASGESSGTLPPVNGPVYGVESDGAGGWYIGGQFTKVGSVPATNLVHLLPDLSVDQKWDAGVRGTYVTALVKEEDRLYVGGSFSRIGGVQQANLGVVNAADGSLVSWNAEVSGAVYTVVVTNGLAYVGGAISSVGSSNRNSVAAIDLVTAKANGWNPNADAAVLALAVAGDVVYVGGQFTSIGGKPRNRLAALDTTTGQATTWNPNPNALVRALAVTDSTVYVGGDFTTISVQNRAYLAAVNRSNGAGQALNLQLEGTTAGPVRSLRLIGNTLYIAGSFSKVQGSRHALVTAVDLTTGEVVPTAPQGSEYYGGQWTAYVSEIAASATQVLFGGEFYSLGGAPRSNLAAVSARTGELLPWVANASNPVYALAYGTNQVFAGGTFTNVNGTDAAGLVALDPTTGASLADFAFTATNDSYNPAIYSLLYTDGKLYLGGQFSSVGGSTARGLAAVNPILAVPLTFAPNVRGGSKGPAALALGGDTLYLGGDFTQVGGVSRYRLAAVNASDGTLLDWNPAPNRDVKSLSLVGDRLYVGGEFTQITGVTLKYLAAFEVPSLTLMPLDAALSQSSSSVEAVNATDTVVYVGGYFDGIGGEYRQNVAALGPWTVGAFEWDPATYTYPPLAIGLSDSLICLGGSFPLVGKAPDYSAVGYLAVYNRGAGFTTNSYVDGKLAMETTTGDRTIAILQSSSDFTTWSNVATNDNPGYRWSIEQPIEATAGARVFRVRTE